MLKVFRDRQFTDVASLFSGDVSGLKSRLAARLQSMYNSLKEDIAVCHSRMKRVHDALCSDEVAGYAPWSVLVFPSTICRKTRGSWFESEALKTLLSAFKAADGLLRVLGQWRHYLIELVARELLKVAPTEDTPSLFTLSVGEKTWNSQCPMPRHLLEILMQTTPHAATNKPLMFVLTMSNDAIQRHMDGLEQRRAKLQLAQCRLSMKEVPDADNDEKAILETQRTELNKKIAELRFVSRSVADTVEYYKKELGALAAQKTSEFAKFAKRTDEFYDKYDIRGAFEMYALAKLGTDERTKMQYDAWVTSAKFPMFASLERLSREYPLPAYPDSLEEDAADSGPIKEMKKTFRESRSEFLHVVQTDPKATHRLTVPVVLELLRVQPTLVKTLLDYLEFSCRQDAFLVLSWYVKAVQADRAKAENYVCWVDQVAEYVDDNRLSVYRQYVEMILSVYSLAKPTAKNLVTTFFRKLPGTRFIRYATPSLDKKVTFGNVPDVNLPCYKNALSRADGFKFAARLLYEAAEQCEAMRNVIAAVSNPDLASNVELAHLVHSPEELAKLKRAVVDAGFLDFDFEYPSADDQKKVREKEDMLRDMDDDEEKKETPTRVLDGEEIKLEKRARESKEALLRGFVDWFADKIEMSVDFSKFKTAAQMDVLLRFCDLDGKTHILRACVVKAVIAARRLKLMGRQPVHDVFWCVDDELVKQVSRMFWMQSRWEWLKSLIGMEETPLDERTGLNESFSVNKITKMHERSEPKATATATAAASLQASLIAAVVETESEEEEEAKSDAAEEEEDEDEDEDEDKREADAQAEAEEEQRESTDAKVEVVNEAVSEAEIQTSDQADVAGLKAEVIAKAETFVKNPKQASAAVPLEQLNVDFLLARTPHRGQLSELDHLPCDPDDRVTDQQAKHVRDAITKSESALAAGDAFQQTEALVSKIREISQDLLAAWSGGKREAFDEANEAIQQVLTEYREKAHKEMIDKAKKTKTPVPVFGKAWVDEEERREREEEKTKKARLKRVEATYREEEKAIRVAVARIPKKKKPAASASVAPTPKPTPTPMTLSEAKTEDPSGSDTEPDEPVKPKPKPAKRKRAGDEEEAEKPKKKCKRAKPEPKERRLSRLRQNTAAEEDDKDKPG